MIYETQVTQRIIGLAINVHKHLGPGLLESMYEESLCMEMQEAGVNFTRQLELPVTYRGTALPMHYRLDLLVENKVVLEIKSIESILKVHQAQLLTYMRLCKVHVGLIINFNVPVLKQGLKRMVL